jgi:hypothetical protein
MIAGPERWSVTHHASERWEERFGGEDMGRAMRRALPFGAQLGKQQYFLDTETDAVFVVALEKQSITTVLSKMMAIANMQDTVLGTQRLDFSEPLAIVRVTPEEEMERYAIRWLDEFGMDLLRKRSPARKKVRARLEAIGLEQGDELLNHFWSCVHNNAGRLFRPTR